MEAIYGLLAQFQGIVVRSSRVFPPAPTPAPATSLSTHHYSRARALLLLLLAPFTFLLSSLACGPQLSEDGSPYSER